MDPKTPAEKQGYHVGDHFKVKHKSKHLDEGNIVRLHKDDGTDQPEFQNVSGPCDNPDGTDFVPIEDVEKVPDVDKALKKSPNYKLLIFVVIIAGIIAYQYFA